MDEAWQLFPDGSTGNARRGLIIGCSALKVKYRRILRGFSEDYNASSKPDPGSPASRRHVHILYLKGTFAGLSLRVQQRRDHFMPPSLLQSQFDALEEPTDEEQVDDEGEIRGKLVIIPISFNPQEIISRFIKEISC